MARSYESYRTHTTTRRLRGYDYGSAGWYFVTVCTKGRAAYFGEVGGGVMRLNAAGCIASARCLALESHPPCPLVEAFVVMPNHLHLLVALQGGAERTGDALASPRGGTLGAVVRSLKSGITQRVREAGHPFAWQPRYHDRIVRDVAALHHIRAYIKNNPAKWREDCHNPSNHHYTSRIGTTP